MDRGTQSYIDEERKRCVDLVKMLHAEPDFLLYCIKAPIYPTEDIASHRKRFGEFDPQPAALVRHVLPEDDFADLM